MKLIRLGESRGEKPFALVGPDSVVDLSDVVNDFDESFFASGRIAELPAVVAAGTPEPIGGRRIGAPIARLF
jgi:2,4-didehydro-3-deoxy-L-rhamnonate hydrolase